MVLQVDCLWLRAQQGLDRGLAGPEPHLSAAALELAGTLMQAETTCDAKAAGRMLQSLLGSPSAVPVPEVEPLCHYRRARP